MNLVQAAVLGIVQGLTEFLPISSSGHLRIVPALLGWRDPGAAFTAVIQIGTMAAIVVFFWRDIVRIVWTWLRSLWTAELRSELDARMGWYIIAGTIPVGVLGLVFADQIQTAARDLRLIGAAFILLAIVLLIAERLGRRVKTVESVTFRDSIVIGCFQALALIPGSSRSGSTITGALFLGYEREAAARYSFLLSIPAVVASGLFELKDIGGHDTPGLAPTLVATLLAFVVGYVSIAWLLRYLTQHTTVVFIAYRIAVGALLFGLLARHVLSAN